MRVDFVKMQGLGNDFVVIDDRARRLSLGGAQAARLCDRRFGIGADGVLVLRAARDTQTADVSWDFFNADGSLGEMCGNGIRCLARFALEAGALPAATDTLRVETLAGVKTVAILRDACGAFAAARVDMGVVRLEDEADRPLLLGERQWWRVQVGNPHVVTFLDDSPLGASERDRRAVFGTAPVTTEGPLIECNPVFPHKTNVEFAQVCDRTTIDMRVWERGVGETLACGTGACAVAAVARCRGLVDEQVSVNLLGGTLAIEVMPDLRVYMTGSAEAVFSGTIELQ
jgi:diaminopimelate epimerase